MNPTFAELLLQENGVSRPEEIDLEGIAYDQGATVSYRRMDSCEARIIGYGTTAVISINISGHPNRQRFSLAHELRAGVTVSHLWWKDESQIEVVFPL